MTHSHITQVGAWSDCSHPCDGGIKVREVACYRVSASGGKPQPVTPDACPIEDMPPAALPCNMAPCPTREPVLVDPPSGTCSSLTACYDDSPSPAGSSAGLSTPAQPSYKLIQCFASNGLMVPLSVCTNASAPTSSTGRPAGGAEDPWPSWCDLQFSVPANRSAAVQLTAPASLSELALNSSRLQVACQGSGPCSTGAAASAGAAGLAWRFSPWSNCSLACGGGRRLRTAWCEDSKAGKAVSDSACQQAIGLVPSHALSQPCNSPGCGPRYSWSVGEWSACMGSSILGYMERRVACTQWLPGRNTSSTVENARCIEAIGSAPPASSSCLKPPNVAICTLPGLAKQQSCFGRGTCTYSGGS